MNWDDLRYFLPVARSGSLTKASELLEASQSTVGRRIQELERAIGVRLFARHQTGYFLTDEGRELLHRAERIESQILDLEHDQDLRGEKAVGLVRLATAENIANAILIPELGSFRQRYPAVTLDISTSARSVSLLRREGDIALRLVRPTQKNLIVRKLGVQAHAVYASHDYLLKKQIEPGDPVPWDRMEFINWDEEYATLPIARWIAEKSREGMTALVASSLGGHLAATCAGLGVAMLPCFLGDRERGLRRLVEPEDSLRQDIWLVQHPDLISSARVRAVSDFIVDVIERRRALLLGEKYT